MSSSDIKLSVILLFFHGDRWIDSCTHSLENQSLSRDKYEIILVDNGGSTPAVERHRGKKNVNILLFHENYGFAAGNNRALKHAKGEMILLLNQDVIVHSDCLNQILKAHSYFPEAGAISTNMIMVSSKDEVIADSFLNGDVGLFKLTRFGYASYSYAQTDKDALSVGFVSGNGLSFRKEIVKEVGNYLFDYRLKNYAEDLDFSIRIKKTGRKMYIIPKALIYHYRDEAFSGKLKSMLYKFINISGNRLMVYYNNLTVTGFLEIFPLLLLGIALKAAKTDNAHFSNPFRFIAALILLPAVLFNFLFKVSSNPALETIDSAYHE